MTRTTMQRVLWLSIVLPLLHAQGQAEGRQNPSRPRRDHPSFVQLEDQPGLPRVLLLGDSISMQYTLPVRARLQGIANIHRPPTNCRSTRQTLAELDEYLGSGAWDVIHFNCGIHDVTALDADGKAAAPPEGKLQVSLEEYEQNMKQIVERLQKTGALLIWASTTPIGAKTESRGYRRDQDVTEYNAAAARIVKSADLMTNDLYTLVKPRAEELLGDGVHANEAGVEVVADQVATTIRRALAASSTAP